ncbi:HNH endonuclease signature motif containing protein, partial [Arthrobacter sp. PM3]|uniref:HNH endonuclease n=1 Tax=Arthrobacter sp. PM3 TaxID=2017685 RepID=UPI000E10ADA0
MEAVGDFFPDRAAGPGSVMVSGSVSGSGVAAVVGRAVALLRAAAGDAHADAALFDFFEAADFAELVEGLACTAEHLQIIAAAAVDRTRREAAAAHKAPAGWGTDPNTGTETDTRPDTRPDAGAGTDAAISAGAGRAAGWLTGWTEAPAISATGTGPAGVFEAGVSAAAVCAVADDGYRNTAEFLRGRLRISAPEARRRLTLAAGVLPRAGMTGQALPPARPELAAAVAAGIVASRTATIIALSLERAGHVAPPAAVDRMEHALTRTAVENDADFLARVARRWLDALDQDGPEPSEELLRRRQGAFIRQPRHGLHHVEIFATADQYEHLATVMNLATNPRLPGPGDTETAGTPDSGPGTDGAPGDGTADGPDSSPASNARAGASDSGGDGPDPVAARLDPRTRPQRLLDGLIGACKAGLAAGTLPAAGGLRPQIMATINYRDLLDQLTPTGLTPTGAGKGPGTGAPGTTGTDGRGGTDSPGGALPGTGSLLFTGPVTASTVRKIACDADIIPVLLGTAGRVLDIGRASRIFPPHIRKALIARDQGCAFPGCTIPASWCEAHHIDYWSRGGSTGT